MVTHQTGDTTAPVILNDHVCQSLQKSPPVGMVCIGENPPPYHVH